MRRLIQKSDFVNVRNCDRNPVRQTLFKQLAVDDFLVHLLQLALSCG